MILCWQRELGHSEKLHQENRHIPQARAAWHLRGKLVVVYHGEKEIGLLAGRCTRGAGSCFHPRISEDDISVCRVSWFKLLLYTHFQPSPIFKFQGTWRPELSLEYAPLILTRIKLNKEPGRCLSRSLGGDAVGPYSATWRKLPALLRSQSLHLQTKRVTVSFQGLQRLFEIIMDTYTRMCKLYSCLAYNHQSKLTAVIQTVWNNFRSTGKVPEQGESLHGSHSLSSGVNTFCNYHSFAKTRTLHRCLAINI